MGTLAHFGLEAIRARHALESFVETGTGDGAGVAAALRAGFKVIHSIEIVAGLAAVARARFAGHPGIRIHEGDSRTVLADVLAQLPDAPALFWLDAHFPGADYGIGTYESERDISRRLPLAGEIAMIAARRQGKRDVILIDDARIYQRGPYGAGNLPEDWPPLAGITRSLDFVRDAFGSSHGIVIDFAQQGYVMVTPRCSPIP